MDNRSEGYWILDVELDWALRKSWYAFRYSSGESATQEGAEEEINTALQRLPGGEVVPKEESMRQGPAKK